jgi:AraC-like DNA-binding protein
MEQPPSFDTWTSIFLFAVMMGIFLFVLLITNKNRKNRPIAYLVLAFSVILFQYVLYWTRYEQEFGYFMLLPPFCYYLTGPLMLKYVRNLYEKNQSPHFSLHFIPAFLLLIPNLGLWTKYLWGVEGDIPLLWLAQKPWFIVFHMSIYALWVFNIVIKNKDKSGAFKVLRYRWVIVLNSLYLTFVLAYASYYALVGFEFFNAQWDYMISLTMSLSIYAIGFFIFKQPQVFDGEFYTQLFLEDTNKDKSLEQSMLNELFDNVTKYMENKKPYVDNDLRLVNLADQLGFSTHLLSKVINEKSGMNFNQFINEYRLRDAAELLKQEKDLSVSHVYFNVGFNNKATFYSAFKRKHHCTPVQYREQLSGS